MRKIVCSKRVCKIVSAVIPVLATVSTERAFAAGLTVATWSGGNTLTSSGNYTPAVLPSSGSLIDIVHSTTVTITGAFVTAGTTTVLNTGGLAVDYAPGSEYFFDSSDGMSATATTINFAGGNTTGTSAPITLPNDLITLTGNVGAATVDFRGNNGGITLNMPSSGGNLNVASTSTLEFDTHVTLAGSGALTLTGSGTVLLNNGVNSGFTGGININSGTLSIIQGGGLGATTNTTTFSGGTLSVAANVAFNSARVFNLTTAAGDIDVTGTNTGTFLGPIIGTGGFIKTGTGTLDLQGTGTYGGAQTVAGGVLEIATATQLGATPTVPTNNIILSGGTLMLTGITSTPAYNVNRTVVLGNGASGGVGTIDVVSTSAFAGPFVDSGGAGTLTKIDTGTLILEDGSSTYSGGTNVNAGLLLVANGSTGSSATGSGPVTVGGTSAGSFGGNGTVAGNITVNSTGTLVPGTFQGSSIAALQPGTLTGGGSLTLHSGSTVIEKIASSTSFDTTALSNVGSVNFDSATSSVNLSLLNVGSPVISLTDKYVLISFPTGETINNFTPTTPGVPGTFVISSAPAGFDVSQASILEESNDIYITGIAATPEPTTAAIGALTAAGLLLRRRRSAKISTVAQQHASV